MAHNVAFRLPPINLLSLDLPLPPPNFSQHQSLPHLVPRQYGTWPVPVGAPFEAKPHQPLEARQPPFGLKLHQNLEPKLHQTLEPTLPPASEQHLPLTLAPKAQLTSEPELQNAPAPKMQSSFDSSAQPAFEPKLQPKVEAPSEPRPEAATLAEPALQPLRELESQTSPRSPLLRDASPAKEWKPRKKRQCPECHLYFSNLATHKSTHLKPTSRPHVCKICQRGFARPNDLFRHFKCHWKEMGADNGQFRCPFKNGARGDHCCHTLGIFSRCDTYKNHLKAIHFQYPGGTKKSQRNQVAGCCRLCQAQFRNVDEWISSHIDTNQCPYTRSSLPE